MLYDHHGREVHFNRLGFIPAPPRGQQGVKAAISGGVDAIGFTIASDDTTGIEQCSQAARKRMPPAAPER